MTPAAANIRALRSALATRKITLSWRSLTGGTDRPDAGRRTLLACSGGCDSSALVLALAHRRKNMVVGHVVHDLRPAAVALADRDVARALAERCGVRFMERHIRVGPGNAEAMARAARYAALAEMAAEAGCSYVATAHHADDALETILMRLLRGAGPRGLAGPYARRALAGGVVLVRPMLVVDRAASEELCRLAGHRWAEDATNLDPTRTRAALRAEVLPVLRRLFPGGATRAVRSASLGRGAARAVEAQARAVLARTTTRGRAVWSRAEFCGLPGVVAGEVLRLAADRLTKGLGADRRGNRGIAAVLAAARSRSTEPKSFAWRGVEVRVTARDVSVRSTEAKAPTPSSSARAVRPRA